MSGWGDDGDCDSDGSVVCRSGVRMCRSSRDVFPISKSSGDSVISSSSFSIAFFLVSFSLWSRCVCASLAYMVVYADPYGPRL